MRLQDYPRPPRDSGWGLHGPAVLAWRPQGISAWFANLRRMNLTWIKWLGNMQANDCDMVRAAADAGLEPIVRLYVAERFPRPLDAGELDHAVRAYVGAGAHYFETGNESNLANEWQPGQFAAYQNRHIPVLVDLWLVDAAIVKAAGGIPVVYAMSVGSSQPDGRLAHWWWRDFLHELAARGRLGALDGAAWGVHIGALNHPLAYPLDPVNVADHHITETDVVQAMLTQNDSSCYQSVRLIQQMLRDAGLPDVPVLSTEGGCFPWDRPDPRYPEVTPEAHRDMLLEIYRRFNPAHPEYWGDALFCQCSWLAIGGSQWPNDQWLQNPRFGGDLPIVQALRQEPRFERVLGGGTMAKFTLGPIFTSHENWVVTRPFGFESPDYADGFHKGTDLARPGTTGTKGALVLAPFDGKVDFVWYREDRGWEVYIYDPSQGVEFCIYHLLLEPNLRAGDDVAMGQVIGHVGDTGALSTGAHAHVGLVKTFSRPPYNIDTSVGRAGWFDIMGEDVIRTWEV